MNVPIEMHKVAKHYGCLARAAEDPEPKPEKPSWGSDSRYRLTYVFSDVLKLLWYRCAEALDEQISRTLGKQTKTQSAILMQSLGLC